NPAAVQAWNEQMQRDGADLFGLIQVFTGGAVGNLALVSLGIMPDITSAIIMQLMTKVSPNLEAIAKEGPSGQRKISQYTRYAAVPVCIVQGFFAARQLAHWSGAQIEQGKLGLLMSDHFGTLLFMTLGMSAGAMFIMWLGEQITERGIGNGASVLIMSGIIARMPAILWQMIEKSRQGSLSAGSIVAILAVYLASIIAVVLVTPATRRIPLQHAKHIRGRRMMTGGRNYLPLKVNTSGVMPVIFASSLLVVPQMLGLVPGLGFMKDLFQRGWFFYSLFYVTMIF